MCLHCIHNSTQDSFNSVFPQLLAAKHCRCGVPHGCPCTHYASFTHFAVRNGYFSRTSPCNFSIIHQQILNSKFLFHDDFQESSSSYWPSLCSFIKRLTLIQPLQSQFPRFSYFLHLISCTALSTDLFRNISVHPTSKYSFHQRALHDFLSLTMSWTQCPHEYVAVKGISNNLCSTLFSVRVPS